MKTKSVRILGIRGVPAAHGGFETFAEYLALYLVKQGWKVTVYCQEDGKGNIYSDVWQGVERIHIPVSISGAKGTLWFDWLSILHAAKSNDLCLTLGYNTALFDILLRCKGIPNLINMDGIEWSRSKWGALSKAWFYLNEHLGCWLGNHLIADHPEIKNHLATRVNPNKITTIAYGAEAITSATIDNVEIYGLAPYKYLTLIARPEPENSILEIVKGFSKNNRGITLAILGKFDTENNAYHRAVKNAASHEVKFLGPIYDKAIVQALRFYSMAYIHGHQVGGTNPSLVEALGAGNPVIAHDNRFNRWVAGSAALFFHDADDFSLVIDKILNSPTTLQSMRASANERFSSEFTWSSILTQYEKLFLQFLIIK